MLTNEQLKNITEECAEKGYSVTVRDIAFIVLSNEFDDISVAYKAIFGSEPDFNISYATTYNETSSIKYLRSCINDNTFDIGQIKKKDSNYDDISFEENKAYLLKLKKDTERAMEKEEIEVKDGLKILADITVKLNDKFAVQDNSAEQMVIVNCKYNSVCECGREIYIPTKEDLMQKYNLIEKEK
ncbi:MAG: hypothetical protein ACI4N3_05360 [Alphaproteobacteria bacterium]